MLFCFVAFLLVAGMAVAVFISSVTSPRPVAVTEKASEKGQAYNRVIEQAQARQTLGWKHTLNVKLDLDRQRRVVVRMRDKNNRPLSGGGVVIRFFRPVEDGMEFDVTLKETLPGVYMALAEFPVRGKWDAYIAVRVGEEIYRAHERLILQ